MAAQKNNGKRLWIMRISAVLLSFAACFLAVEIGFRLLDPFPRVASVNVNRTEHGNLSMYDELLGWRGVPNARDALSTENTAIELAHNSEGFRDIEHGEIQIGTSVALFLGDSFTWGYEVSDRHMFVNRLRNSLPDQVIVNLSHRGYGTDQELLALKGWRPEVLVSRVFLMFSENDIDDNNSTIRYDKPKPKFELDSEGELRLTGVPVEDVSAWRLTKATSRFRREIPALAWASTFVDSHFLRDVCFRFDNHYHKWACDELLDDQDLELTNGIIQEVNQEVIRRGGHLIVVFIPSKHEIYSPSYVPYQYKLIDKCNECGIEFFDLGPSFRAAKRRTYFRRGMHWNPEGHRVAAAALQKYLCVP